jgi:hypothetical protein
VRVLDPFHGRAAQRGRAPLRGRAALELIVPTFDFRQAAEFWAASDHRLAAFAVFRCRRNSRVPDRVPAGLSRQDAAVIWLLDAGHR